MIEYSSTLFCSLEANRFYEGISHLRSLRPVRFERDFTCLHDCNAVFVKFEDGVVLGHVEQHVLAAIAPLIYHSWVSKDCCGI